MKKILIVQNTILQYRKPVYKDLSRDYDVTIQHSGDRSVNENDKYRELISPAHRMGPFFVQADVLSEIRKGRYDVVIVMFDLRWLASQETLLWHWRDDCFPGFPDSLPGRLCRMR